MLLVNSSTDAYHNQRGDRQYDEEYDYSTLFSGLLPLGEKKIVVTISLIILLFLIDKMGRHTYHMKRVKIYHGKF